LVDQSADYLPLRQRFDELNWPTISPLNGAQWELKQTNFGNSATVQAFNEGIVGEEVWLATPVLDFSNIDKASMIFDYSYAFTNTKSDQLRILASTDCGKTYQLLSATSPFIKSGSDLSTAPSGTTVSWTPSTNQHWEVRHNIDLTQFSAEAQVRIAFVFTNATGNNLYLDNIEFFTDN